MGQAWAAQRTLEGLATAPAAQVAPSTVKVSVVATAVVAAVRAPYSLARQ